jgi:hypothetical protein
MKKFAFFVENIFLISGYMTLFLLLVFDGNFEVILKRIIDDRVTKFPRRF